MTRETQGRDAESTRSDAAPRCVILTPPNTQAPRELQDALTARNLDVVETDHHLTAAAEWLIAARRPGPAILVLIDPRRVFSARSLAALGREYIQRAAIWVYDENDPAKLRAVTPADLPRVNEPQRVIVTSAARGTITPRPIRTRPALRLATESEKPASVPGPSEAAAQPEQVAQTESEAEQQADANDKPVISEEELRMLMEDPPSQGATGSD